MNGEEIILNSPEQKTNKQTKTKVPHEIVSEVALWIVLNSARALSALKKTPGWGILIWPTLVSYTAADIFSIFYVYLPDDLAVLLEDAPNTLTMQKL
jgi:hypothetical protein